MRIIEIIADAGHLDTITGIAEQHEVTECWHAGESLDGRLVVKMLVQDASRQAVIDALQGLLGASENARIIVQPVEVVLPRLAKDELVKSSPAQTREELYNAIEHGARLDINFFVMVFLSTVVASIGLIEDNIAVIIGAMVIAPLLGPNIALAFGTSLGDRELVWKALKTNVAGVSLAFVMTILIGFAWPDAIHSEEILLRTDVGLDGVALALASGAAAVLSLASGVSSALVGVMVAVALLPPTATLGMLLGSGETTLALGAALLLAVNVVCVNLAAKLMFLLKGVRPRTWLEKRKARQSFAVYILFWIITLGVLLTAIVLRHRFMG